MTKIEDKKIAFLSRLYSITVCKGYVTYFVGGFIRDWLLNRENSDVDIIIQGDVFEIAREIAGETAGKHVVLDAANRIARVIVTDNKTQFTVDLSELDETIESDLAQRDFTINAIAIRLEDFLSGEVNFIDPLKGRNDLKKKIIRVVDPLAFQNDPIRLLRGVRLAAELNFRVDPETEELMKKNSHLIKSAAGERSRDEILKIFALHNSSAILRYLDRLSLLTELIPEIEEMRNVEQPKEHYWNVLEHSFETVSTIEFLLRQKKWEYGTTRLLKEMPWSHEIESHFDEKISYNCNRKLLLKFGGLLHDIAKPQSRSVDNAGRIRFLGHTKRGAEQTVAILSKLRFSKREIKVVETLVYYHLRPMQLANAGLPTTRAIYRYFRDTGDTGIDILFLALADYLAARGPYTSYKEWKQINKLVRYGITEHEQQGLHRLPAKLINGHDIMNIFCLTSGPLIGKLLRLVYEAQATGEITSREDAINLIAENIHVK